MRVLMPISSGASIVNQISCTHNQRARSHAQFLWYHHALANKRSMHGQSVRQVAAEVAQHGAGLAQQHRTEWRRRMAVLQSESLDSLAPHVSSTESFTGGVSKTVVGSKVR